MRTWVCTIGLVGSVALVSGRSLEAQEDPGPLITDRPDQTESSATVTPGHLQLELGWGFTEVGVGAAEMRAHAVPGTLARLGVVPRLELRLGFDGWQSAEIDRPDPTPDATTTGVGDMEVGFKYQLAPGGGGRPQIALLAGATLPTGDAGFSSERVDPTVLVLASRDLGERVSLGSNAGFSWSSGPDGAGDIETLVDFRYTAAVGFGLTDVVGAFAETFGAVALESAGVSTYHVDGGFTFLVRRQLQLDVSGGVGLNDAADDWFVGAGVSVRFPR